MLRAAAWTVGLFGAGMIITQLYPIAWLEPVVLLALGIAFLAVSASSGPRARRAREVEPKQVAA